ncbi:protein of unknown function [Magnetospirillum gryphiswaldense MSR-1 v2]|uniref:PD(D/E)XK endonuclease domain-containing protein n=1 Tax=Magnetospirillum gryphiswaldense (strain DSM 6361 / JCM 21280 / NBRC 15271 / MSR-1) TaxID=431944 RepID=V6F736_MAGGM|nr:protein of unknown function [Magnetospirillum gryphiswaldense MSR-1 v2]
MEDASLFDAAGIQLPRRATGHSDGHRPRLNVSRELELGKAAEHLACADLLLGGWTAYTTDQGLPYDVVVDVGNQLVRVQVKSTFCPKNPQPSNRSTPAYFFNIRRAGKGGKRTYGESEFDVYALVALDRRAVAYFAVIDLPTSCVVLRIPGAHYGFSTKQFRTFEGATFEHALDRLQPASTATG